MEGSFTDLALAKALTDFTLEIANPIVWYDRKEPWSKRIYGGSCFFLRFANEMVGVTANHVVDALQDAVTMNRDTVCQIRTSLPFNLNGLIIDRCPRLDVATFQASNELLEAIGATPLDCRGGWPPPEPTVGRTVTMCGFPKAERETPKPGVLAAFAYGSLAVIDAVTERDVIVTYDSAREAKAPWAPWKPPLSYNMSGCSGGPALSHGSRNGIQRWFPVAMILSGPKGRGTGDAEGWDIITLRRIDSIQADGTIKRNNAGWLPG